MPLLDWIQAMRPRTLVAAAIPVAIAGAVYRLHSPAHEGWMGSLAWCGGFALLAQVASNFANDLGDGLRGTDGAGRLGPPRAVADGRISARAMAWGVTFAVFLAFLTGLVASGAHPWLILAGVLALALALGYTLGPYPLAYKGLGDVFVVACFGIQATVLTGYVLWRDSALAPPYAPVDWAPLLASLAVAGLGLGCLADNLLLANNARDRETDAAVGKRTTVVRFGLGFARALHAFNLAVGLGCLAWVFGWPPLLLAPLALLDHLGFRRAASGADFAPFLARAALFLLLAGALCITGACLGWGVAVR
jgi:1,4-dihydroxy-2-naphthoate octaprenyltransferase